jgi:act minimal PKS chain-length factor (CLF/KS beta)
VILSNAAFPHRQGIEWPSDHLARAAPSWSSRTDRPRTSAAPAHGTIAGHAATFDPAQGLGRPRALRRAVQLALDDAGLDPGEVDVVFADAAGTRTEDRAEAEALAEVFGPYGVPVTAPDCPVDLVIGRPRKARLRNALVVARGGYGGFNAALVVRRFTDRIG